MGFSNRFRQQCGGLDHQMTRSLILMGKTGSEMAAREPELPLPVLNKTPEQVTMPKPETKQEAKLETEPENQSNPISLMRRGCPVPGSRNRLGRKLGQGQFGTTFLCVEKSTGKEYACKSIEKRKSCKSIAKRKLLTDEDVEDVRREIQIMHHLAGHPNVISIKGAYEDAVAVHVVMELCAGGELYDRIIQRGHYTERKAAALMRTIVGEDSLLKDIDFGLSIFFKPEADVWSAGVILYILLSGVPPFWAENEQGIFEEVLHGDLDFDSDPRRRLTAHERQKTLTINFSVATSSKPMQATLGYRLMVLLLTSLSILRFKSYEAFSAMNKLKKMALRISLLNAMIRHNGNHGEPSEEEIAGLKEMFKMIDADSSCQITFEELKAGLKELELILKSLKFMILCKHNDKLCLMQMSSTIQADVDNSGTIDYGEFVAATLHLNKIEKEDHLFAAFSILIRMAAVTSLRTSSNKLVRSLA
ncbi:calcium-dependent protein kinase 1-like [Hibiscus syriacus]|uniref:calcium-dependent protein kinase 1-like n=1 Tax=Hibiscus syriacus TaxID=106335 RepID=UPI001924E6EE|nr:calcium-dependent protein kinase 1-like [Hibiscus syriacus]